MDAGLLEIITHLLSLLIFALIPLWLIMFVAGYICQIKKIKKTSSLMPLSLFFSQAGLLYFYYETHKLIFFNRFTEPYPVESFQNPFLVILGASFAITALLVYIENDKKYHFYLIPLFLLFGWVLLYLYF